MWAPADTTARPTAGDMLNAKTAIEVVKAQLKDAPIALAQAKLRVSNIEKDLRERCAWISPVRKLPLDVLSIIFEICGEDDWKIMLRIAVVSRMWRGLALSTPRAWSFIDLKRCDDREMIQTFFERSGQLPLHIDLPATQSVRFLLNVAHRLECLLVERLDYDADQISFPKLRRLTLWGETNIGIASLSYLGLDRFPALRHLECALELFRGASTSSGIAPLHTLSIAIARRFASLDLLKCVKDTLSCLKLDLYNEPSNPLSTAIVFSSLKYLQIHYWEIEPDLWPLTLVTPVLETYIEWSGAYHSNPIHPDVGKVKFLRFGQAPTLSSFPMIVVLQLEEADDIDKVLSQLTNKPALCPELALIEVAPHLRMSDVEGRVAEINKRRPSKRITIVPGPLRPLVGIIPESPVSHYVHILPPLTSTPVWRRNALQLLDPPCAISNAKASLRRNRMTFAQLGRYPA
jgi:hypothetical protein